jgi:DNA polymerase III epsilon subunit-like protein
MFVLDRESKKLCGKSESQFRDKTKPSQKQILKEFNAWVLKRNFKNALCQNPSFDFGFIKHKTAKYGIGHGLRYRCFDLHTLAQTIHFQTKGQFLLDENSDSMMNLENILKFCNVPTKRKTFDFYKGTVSEEGTAHDALEDIRLTAECASRLLYGKNLFDEFAQHKVPDYLIK